MTSLVANRCLLANQISFSLFGTRNQQENYPIFLMIFWFCPFYGQKIQEKVSKSENANKNGLGKYLSYINEF